VAVCTSVLTSSSVTKPSDGFTSVLTSSSVTNPSDGFTSVLTSSSVTKPSDGCTGVLTSSSVAKPTGGSVTCLREQPPVAISHRLAGDCGFAKVYCMVIMSRPPGGHLCPTLLPSSAD